MTPGTRLVRREVHPVSAAAGGSVTVVTVGAATAGAAATAGGGDAGDGEVGAGVIGAASGDRIGRSDGIRGGTPLIIGTLRWRTLTIRITATSTTASPGRTIPRPTGRRTHRLTATRRLAT